jgi:hypothetical protein
MSESRDADSVENLRPEADSSIADSMKKAGLVGGDSRKVNESEISGKQVLDGKNADKSFPSVSASTILQKLQSLKPAGEAGREMGERVRDGGSGTTPTPVTSAASSPGDHEVRARSQSVYVQYIIFLLAPHILLC